MSTGEPPLVVHVIHHLVTGGMENGLVNIINAMPERAYRHAIACIEDYSDFRDRIRRPDVEVVALRRSKVGARGVRARLRELFLRLRPAIVHSRNMSGLDAILPAWRAGVPHRLHGEHGWDVGDLRGERWKPAILRRLHAPFVSRYVAVSLDLARYLERRVGVSPSRISHICNGVDTSRYAPKSGARMAVLPPEWQDERLVIVGTVGRIQPVKDQAGLLKSFAEIVRQGGRAAENWRLAVIGDGPLLADLRELSRTLGIEDRIWLPGSRDDVPDILRSFDLFVLPSLNEGISNTILEALATGLPVIVTRVGGNPELVEDGVTGRVVPAADVGALAGAIGELLVDQGRRQRLGAAARRAATERFGLDTMVARYQALYDALIGGDRPIS